MVVKPGKDTVDEWSVKELFELAMTLTPRPQLNRLQSSCPRFQDLCSILMAQVLELQRFRSFQEHQTITRCMTGNMQCLQSYNGSGT